LKILNVTLFKRADDDDDVQEFIRCTLSNGICNIDSFRARAYAPSRTLSTNLYDLYHCWVYSE